MVDEFSKTAAAIVVWYGVHVRFHRLLFAKHLFLIPSTLTTKRGRSTHCHSLP